MNGIHGAHGATGSASRKRKLKVAPVTRAVRSALAASAAMLALAGSGPALAGDCTAPVDGTIHCNGDFADTLNFSVEDLTLIVGDEAPSTIAPATGPGILADWAGNIGVTNSADITAYADGIDAIGSGDIDLQNDADIDVSSAGQVIGIYAYTDGGDVTIANGGDITAYSMGGLADGIFASGGDVAVSNSGAIGADGYDWAAGIEAQGTGATSVSNDGDISAYAYAAGGYAFGIYATGADVTVANGGTVDAQGYNANGVYVQSGGNASIDNGGSVTAGGLYTSLYATGIHAASGGLDSAVSVTNGGDVTVNGYAGATGIEALATGAGSSASIDNSGDVYVNSYYKYAAGSTGIVASADGDATVDNSGGIEVIASGVSYGAMALSFNGDASVTNSGDIAVSNTAILYYAAAGIVSSSQNGAAFADNDGGSIDVSTKYIGTGIDASGLAGATVSNSGDIAVDAWRAYGIRANSGAGDVSVDNSGDISATYTGTLSPGQAWGILALSGAGDISVVNSGDIVTDVDDQSVGIFARPTAGSASVTNTGTIEADSYTGTAAGIFARADYGDVAVDNGGSITAYATYGYAYGVLGSGVNIDVANGGSIYATGFYAAAGINVYGQDSATVSGDGSIQAVAYGIARGINATSGAGDVSVDNGGDVFAGSVLLDAIGVYAYSATGDVDVSNGGYVRAVSPNGLADGIFAYGANVSVANAEGGAIVAQGYNWAAGIEAQGSDSVAVTNAGDIVTQTIGASEAFGVYAVGGDGGATVDNSGTIHIQGYDQATGVYARASGGVGVTNAGDIYAGYAATDAYGNTYASSYASAILAVSGAEGANISIDSSGYLYAVSFSASSGAEARSLGAGGSASVANSGDVLVGALAYGGSATGIVATADGDASADNAGGITAISGGMAYGAMALSFNGDASVTNTGDIDASNGAFRYYSAYGIVSASQNGSASADNGGNIHVYSPYIGVGVETAGLMGAEASNSGDIAVDGWVSYGMRTTSGQGDVMVDNSGSIAAYYSGSFPGYSFGMLAKTTGGDIAIDNSGDISSDGGRQGIGIFATTTGGDVSIDSSGDVHASTYIGGSVGIFARASSGTATISSSGDVDSTATYGNAYGVLARGVYLDATTSGDTSATGYYGAYGVYLDGGAYATLHNSGDISATTGGGFAAGVVALATYGVEVINSGHITATADTGGTAVGVIAQAYYDVVVDNSGTISASHPDQAIAVALSSTAGTATLVNSGTITTEGAPASGSIAFLGSHGANQVVNSGDIYGNIITFDADDSIENSGTLHLSYTGIYLGGSASAGNSFENTGTIRTDGYGVIDMGTGPASLVASANPLPLVNDGVIDFVDGSPDDQLTIFGDLGGDGAINLDLSVLNGGADLLYVDGNVVDGTTQAINLSIDGTPTALKGTAAPVVAISGNVPAGSFVGGHVLNFDATNFLDLGVRLGTASSGGTNVLTAAVDVNGLNGTGTLGASVVQGMRSLVNSAVGTRSQRMGLAAPRADGRAGISPWLRIYTDNGNVSPEGAGFGSGADFGFKQENRGREAGIDFAFSDNLSVGLIAGNADGDQRLDNGSGSAHLKQHGVGLYGTWTGDRFYVDVSHRTMNIEARLHAPSGESEASAEGSATSIEAGFTGWSANGFDIVPQVQYTRSKIDVDALSGSQVKMAIDGGTSSRGRVGVALSRTFAAADGFSWTPYGALSAVREFDGKSGFTIADTFSGSTSVEGTGTLAELGVGVRNGGLSVTAGIHWANGGAVDNVHGGQVVVRYGW